MKTLRMTGLAAAGLLLAAVGAGAQTPPALYSATQATAGDAVYAQNCAMCHGANLEGQAGPALVGASFASTSSGKTIGTVFTGITQTMPASNPGGLTHEQYTDVMAYILSKNGYPAGTTALDYTASLASTVPLVSQAK